MTTIKINGMRCAHCSGSVTKALEGIEGLTDVKVDLEKGEATYTEKSPVSLETIKKKITGIGFEVAE